MTSNMLTSLNIPTEELLEYFDGNDSITYLPPKYIKNDADINYIYDNVSQNEIDNYVDKYILEYPYIINLLKCCSDKIKNKYSYLLDGNKFDLI